MRRKAVVHGNKVQDHKNKRRWNESVMPNFIPTSPLVQRRVFTAMSPLQIQGRDDWQRGSCATVTDIPAWKMHASHALIQIGDFCCVWSHVEPWLQTDIIRNQLFFLLFFCLVFSPHVARVIQEALLVSQHAFDPLPLPLKRLLLPAPL